MTRFHDIVPTKYICFEDLRGQDVTVTVRAFTAEKMFANGKQQTRPVRYFEGKAKGMVVNATINDTLTALYGPELEGWVGKRITIYPTTDDRGGQERMVVRVRPTVPPAKPAQKPAAETTTTAATTDPSKEEPKP